jgi:hypothetical protein
MNEPPEAPQGNPEPALRKMLDRLAVAGIVQAHNVWPKFIDLQPTDRGYALLAAVRDIDRLLGGVDREEAAIIFYLARYFPDDLKK